MSFIFSTFQVPLWFLVFALASAAPLWIKWYKLFHKKFISSGVIQNKFFNSEEFEPSEEISIFKKATDNWNASVEHEKKSEALKKSKKQYDISSADQPYVKIVLKILALKGDAGMLIQSISDNLEISSNEIKKSLSYLEKNEFVESVSGSMGQKYYLSPRGKKYCVKRGYIKG
ncbi:MAG TPA: hypothetical protein ENJ28_09925 [Gammaproteobacteria bacterium]|nr:hypothetical protein [Gammaproteobacteria bacterium]